MHSLHGVYAQTFNERWDRVGHLFQSRFGSRWVNDEVQLARVLAYIVVNPVAAGLCAAPEEWPWGSDPAALNGHSPRLVDLPRLRDHLAPLGDLPTVYRALVNARLVSAGLLAPA